MGKILCIGSITADIIVSPVDHLPPRGTLQEVSMTHTCVGGCASNAAIALGKLGVPTALSAKVGNDNFGKLVIDTARHCNVDILGIIVDETVSTTTSVVLVGSDSERSFLYNPGSTSAFTSADIPQPLIDGCSHIFIGGANLLSSFDGEPCGKFLEKMQRQGKYTVLDTAWDFQNRWQENIFPSLPHLDLFMPSYEEAVPLSNETDVVKMADFFLKKGAKNVIIKLGKEGAYVAENNGNRFYSHSFCDEVIAKDTTGAGDSFCAGFLAGLTKGWTFEKCATFANAVGAHCVQAVGASAGIPSLETIVQFILKSGRSFSIE